VICLGLSMNAAHICSKESSAVAKSYHLKEKHVHMNPTLNNV
jgi:hypothetical protein